MNGEPTIQLLPEELQNQIAAGEVIERPSSVLKELLENALDAAATRVAVHIRDGGQSLIHISDNGQGIAEEELILAVTRHATSKIRAVADLQTLSSFGFRGEALASIASVSRFRLASAQREGQGAFVEVHHGKISDQGCLALPRGTEIEIRDLFASVPARLKFLKQPATESRKCAEILLRIALANKLVDFSFQQGDRELYRFLPGQTLRQRLTAVWPEHILETAKDVSHPDGGFQVTGLVGAPSTAQARPDRIYLYVNNRPVQNKTMLSALREAYRGRILGKEYPQAVLFLSLPPAEVDVNVHPAKSEVRFQDDGHIFRLIRRAVLHCLEENHAPLEGRTQELSPEASRTPTLSTTPIALPLSTRETYREYTIEAPPKFSGTKFAAGLCPDPEDRLPLRAPQTPETLPSTEPRFTYLGQIAKTYLVLSTGTGLVLIDQHAAHERVLFNSIRTHSTKNSKQPLVMPLALTLHPAQATEVQDLWPRLLALGFTLELETPHRLLVHAIPPLLSAAASKEFLEDILSAKARTIEDFWALMACKAAIKAGDELATDEALSLIEAWRQLPDRQYCPHGRPVMISWDVKELEKLFKRR